jgi:hypothetical protein
MNSPTVEQFSSADAIWIEVGELYKNLGPHKPGNQLDLPKWARAFFGFDSVEVDRNTVLGHVPVRVIGYEAVDRSVRYADNSMDKLNLPVPGSRDAPATYDHSTLLVERDVDDESGRATYVITPGQSGSEETWKRRYREAIDFQMTGGRRYGLLLA